MTSVYILNTEDRHKANKPLALDHGEQHPEDGKKQQHLIFVQQ